jgi:hypothetical protein
MAPEMLQALRRAAPWLGKMIADGAHQNAVLPNDCVRTLQLVEDVIERAERAFTPMQHGPACDCDDCAGERDQERAEERARVREERGR